MVEQLAGQDVQAQPAPEAKPAAPDFKGTKHKLKIDGQEQEWDYDRLLAEASKGHVADRRFQEAATIRKQIDDMFSGLKSKDLGTFKKMAQAVGPEAFRELAENYLLEHIEYEKLPEGEKRRIAAERRAQALEEELQNKDKESMEAQRSQAKQVALQEIDTEIADALKSYQGKAKPRIVARIVERMLANFSAKDAKLPAARAAEIEFAELDNELRDWLSSKSPEELRGILPKNLIEGLRKADVELARGQFAPRKDGKPQGKEQSSNKKPKRMRSDDWFKNMESRFG